MSEVVEAVLWFVLVALFSVFLGLVPDATKGTCKRYGII